MKRVFRPFLFVVIVVSSVVSLVYAGLPTGHDGFKSDPAKAAVTKYETTLKEAKVALIKDLEAAKDKAMKAGDLDEAVLIRDALRDLAVAPASTPALAPTETTPCVRADWLRNKSRL